MKSGRRVYNKQGKKENFLENRFSTLDQKLILEIAIKSFCQKKHI